MQTELIYPDEVDRRLNWHPGRAAKLARRGTLPHYVLPDGAIRFRWQEVVELVRHVPASEPILIPFRESGKSTEVPA